MVSRLLPDRLAADPLRSAVLAERGADQDVLAPQELRLRADTAGTAATVTGLRDLQHSTLQQAARLPDGARRAQSLTDATRYGRLADDLAAPATGVAHVPPLSAEPRTPEPVVRQGTSGAPSDLAEPLAARRLDPALAGDLHQLRAQHATYSTAEATADASETAFREVRAQQAAQAQQPLDARHLLDGQQPVEPQQSVDVREPADVRQPADARQLADVRQSADARQSGRRPAVGRCPAARRHPPVGRH